MIAVTASLAALQASMGWRYFALTSGLKRMATGGGHAKRLALRRPGRASHHMPSNGQSASEIGGNSCSTNSIRSVFEAAPVFDKTLFNWLRTVL